MVLGRRPPPPLQRAVLASVLSLKTVAVQSRDRQESGGRPGRRRAAGAGKDEREGYETGTRRADCVAGRGLTRSTRGDDPAYGGTGKRRRIRHTNTPTARPDRGARDYDFPPHTYRSAGLFYYIYF